MREFVIILALLFVPVGAQERINITTPVVRPNISGYTVARLTLDRPAATIEVVMLANTADCATVQRPVSSCTLTHVWSGPVATTMMQQLNTANLTTRSLNARILDRLVADGVVAGTVIP